MGCGGAVPCWSAWPRGRGQVSVLGPFLADEGSNEAGGGCWRKVAPRPSVHSAALLHQLRAVASSPLLCPALQLAGTPQCQHGQGNADCSSPASRASEQRKAVPAALAAATPLRTDRELWPAGSKSWAGALSCPVPAPPWGGRAVQTRAVGSEATHSCVPTELKLLPVTRCLWRAEPVSRGV